MLNWLILHTNKLALLADQLSHTIQKRERQRCRNHELKALAIKQIRSDLPKSLSDKGTGWFVLIIKCQVTLKRIVENNWDLEKQKKQKQAQGCSRGS